VKASTPTVDVEPQQLPASDENQAPIAPSATAPGSAAMKPSNVKFGFSKFGFSFSKPKGTSPKAAKTAIPQALGSPLAATVATPRLHDHLSLPEKPAAASDICSVAASNPIPLDNADEAHVAAPSGDPAAPPLHAHALQAPADAKAPHIVGLSSRAQQLIAELAAEDQSFGALDFSEPVKREKRALIEKSNLVRKNVKSGQKYAGSFASGAKHDAAEPAALLSKLSKALPLQSHAAAPGAPVMLAAAAAPVDCKQLEHLKRTIDNLKVQLEAAKAFEKKVVTLENQLAEQNGLIEGMRKDIRQAFARSLPWCCAQLVLFFASGCISGRKCCCSGRKQNVLHLRSNSTLSSR
jgi:hypothetical protein